MKTILFLCTGNVCRSPMAEGLFRHAVKGRGDFRVLSAGLGALDGQPPTQYSVQAMKEIGIDISHQRSRALTTEMVRSADYIFGMTHSHVDTVALLYPQAAEKTFLLREFDDSLESYEKDISDPIGSPYLVYVACRNQIELGIATLLKFMEQHNLLSPIQKPATARLPQLCHSAPTMAALNLRKCSRPGCSERGLTVEDFGAATKDPADDYPDFAKPVAQAVAAGKAEFGLLVCTSGVGVCITANKVAGVRAALVSDAEAAALMPPAQRRECLCLSGNNTPPEPGQKNSGGVPQRQI